MPAPGSALLISTHAQHQAWPPGVPPHTHTTHTSAAYAAGAHPFDHPLIEGLGAPDSVPDDAPGCM